MTLKRLTEMMKKEKIDFYRILDSGCLMLGSIEPRIRSTFYVSDQSIKNPASGILSPS